MSQPHGHIDPEPINGLPAALHIRLLQVQRWGGESELREFALWCALSAIAGKPEMLSTLRSIRNAVQRRDDAALAELHIKLGGSAASAGTIGMRVNPAGASAFFAVFGCTFPDPFETAVRASRYAREYFEYREHKYPPSPSITGDPAAEAHGEALGRQLDYLDQQLNVSQRFA